MTDNETEESHTAMQTIDTNQPCTWGTSCQVPADVVTTITFAASARSIEVRHFCSEHEILDAGVWSDEALERMEARREVIWTRPPWEN